MTLTRQHALEVVGTYIKAWESQDASLILTIFTPAATYHERVLLEPMAGREAIRAYWQSKVQRSQANISVKLLSLYVDGDTAVAEWQAEFDDLTDGNRKRMREIAVLDFDGPLISALREYWASEVTGTLSSA